ncbi:MAG: hypothetical protein M1814_002846 [Vezdaea aestivalis]|nr:MAG: hypothetical protein M1814_002846 [Vezdaea aestivalis]
MTYSGAAAIHGLLLACVYGHGPVDPDAIPIFAIADASTTMTIPLLSWSSSVRKVKAGPILNNWFVPMRVSTALLAIGLNLEVLAVPTRFSQEFEVQGCYGIKDQDFMLVIWNSVSAPVTFFTSAMWEWCKYSSFCDRFQDEKLFRQGSSAQVVL